MIYLYVELRYQRQLSKICPDVPAGFFSDLADSARNNGGSAARLGSAFLYAFDSASVGYAFSASRVIADAHARLSEQRTRIREYFVIVDSVASRMTPEAFRETLNRYSTVITPDEGILLTKDALTALSPYVTTIPLKDTDLSLYSGSRLTESALADAERVDGPLYLYPSDSTDPVSVLRNMVASAPVSASAVDYAEIDGESAYALEARSMSRYSANVSEWIVSASLACLAGRLSCLEKARGKPFTVVPVGASELPESLSVLSELLSERLRLSTPHYPTFLPADVRKMAPDLAELAYLVFRSLEFLYVEELPDFFLHLDKQRDFLASLGSWMYSYGLLADPADFRSLNESLRPALYRRVADERKGLDSAIARFLWTKVESGELASEFPLYCAFNSLGYQVSDSFLISCVYSLPNPLSELSAHEGEFREPALAHAVRELERAVVRYREGNHEETSSICKEVLHVFQKHRVLSGEYRALTLIGMLSIAKRKFDDAIIYLEYALENADRMNDRFAILSSRLDMAMAHFAVGNLHFAQCSLDSANQSATRCFAKDRQALILFMTGRIALELGDVRRAETAFLNASSLAASHHMAEASLLCKVWHARTLAHQGRHHASDPVLAECAGSVPEACAFLLESALIAGRAHTGRDFPETIVDRLESFPLWPDYSRSWDSGFSFSEDLSMGTDPSLRVASRMYRAFRAYYRARFDYEAGTTQACVDELDSLSREAVSVSDPYTAMYYYFYFDSASRLPGSTGADVAVALSRGFKYLQMRANEIGDNALRERFMQQPVWNGRLFRAARENMLI